MRMRRHDNGVPTPFSFAASRSVAGFFVTSEDLSFPVPLASGGFASIWRAGDADQYAIKCFLIGGMKAAEEEYSVMLRLGQSAHVPKVYSLGTFVDGMEKEYPAIVEEFVDGYTLTDVLEKGLLSGSATSPLLEPAMAIAIALEVARGLVELGRVGVSHRDLSTNNVMLRRSCVSDQLASGVSLRIIDFGQSTSARRGTVTPELRARLATVPYGAPEVFGGEHWAVRNACTCDTWSLGAMVVAMLAGEYWPPEIGDLQQGVGSVNDLRRIVDAKRVPIDLRTLMRRMGRQPFAGEQRLCDVVRACTSFDPARRPSPRRLVEELELAAAELRAEGARRASVARTVARPSAASEFVVEGSTLKRYSGSEREVRVPNTVTTISDRAFEGSAVERVYLSQSVRSVGCYAFADCTSLKRVVMPPGVTKLGMGAFWGCTSLRDIVVPDHVAQVPWFAFRGCSSLERVVLPRGLRAIGREAFAGCGSLTHMEVPNAVTEIGDGAFAGCPMLRQASIPPTTQVVSADPFQRRTGRNGTVAV